MVVLLKHSVAEYPERMKASSYTSTLKSINFLLLHSFYFFAFQPIVWALQSRTWFRFLLQNSSSFLLQLCILANHFGYKRLCHSSSLSCADFWSIFFPYLSILLYLIYLACLSGKEIMILSWAVQFSLWFYSSLSACNFALSPLLFPFTFLILKSKD